VNRAPKSTPRTSGPSVPGPGNPAIQLFKLQVTIRVQGFDAACKMAEEIKIHTGAAPIISRL